MHQRVLLNGDTKRKSPWVAGINSHHPFFPKKHYVFIDIDCDIIEWKYGSHCKRSSMNDILEWIVNNPPKELEFPFTITLEESEHGFHLYIWQSFTRGICYRIMRQCPFLDEKWAKIGWKRGSWFLRSTETLKPPVCVSYYAIKGGKWYKSKTANA